MILGTVTIVLVNIFDQGLTCQIEELYSIEPPKPVFISYHYWTSGVHFWKPNYDMNKYYESVQKPFDDKQIYICGETF